MKDELSDVNGPQILDQSRNGNGNVLLCELVPEKIYQRFREHAREDMRVHARITPMAHRSNGNQSRGFHVMKVVFDQILLAIPPNDLFRGPRVSIGAENCPA